MSFAFFLIDVFNGDEYASFFYVAKFVVDCCAEHFHCGREVHVGIDEWRYVFAESADFAVEYFIVFFYGFDWE